MGTAVGFFKEIAGKLVDSGYRVEARILDSAYLGVPQSRRRLFFVGFRDDLELDPVFPDPVGPPLTLRDAIGDLDPDDVEGDESFVGYAIERKWRLLKPGTNSKKYVTLVRPRWDRPCPTVTQTGGNVGASSVTHPDLPRKFTIGELRRICGFPEDFVLTGSYRQRYERLGRAVPPPVAEAVARRIREELERKDDAS